MTPEYPPRGQYQQYIEYRCPRCGHLHVITTLHPRKAIETHVHPERLIVREAEWQWAALQRAIGEHECAR